MIQIDKPMPEGCDVCPLMYDYIQCNALPEGCEDDDDFNKDEFDWTKRPDWCPLKEQGAVSITTDYFDGFGNRTSHCPSCNSRLVWHQNKNYCGECGQAVKWE